MIHALYYNSSPERIELAETKGIWYGDRSVLRVLEVRLVEK